MSVIRFTPVSEITEPLNLAIGLSGGSGTGKTYSALLMARGIAEVVTGRKGAPIGFIDTENRRALHYKSAFPEMVHCDMRADDENGDIVGFGPERWIEYIDAAEAAELPVIVIDSFSHSHEGVGGMLDLHATTLDRIAAWHEVHQPEVASGLRPGLAEETLQAKAAALVAVASQHLRMVAHLAPVELCGDGLEVVGIAVPTWRDHLRQDLR